MKKDVQVSETAQLLIKGLNKSYRKLLASKKQSNLSLVVTVNGKIVEIKP
jgi:hypothetical protein